MLSTTRSTRFPLFVTAPLFVTVLLVLSAPRLAADPADPPPAEPVLVDAGDASALARQGLGLSIGGRLTVAGLSLDPADDEEILDLERFEVFAPDARLVVMSDDGEQQLAPPDNAYFRGSLASDPASRAVLSVRASGEVRGLLQRGGETWLFASVGEAPGDARLESRRAEAEELEQLEKFACGNDDFDLVPPDDPLDSLAAAPQATTIPYTARVAVDSDYEFFLELGSDVDDAFDYIAELFAFGSYMYDTEVLTNLLLVYARIWTGPADPWTQGNSLCGLLEFGRHWNDLQSSVSRTIAHFLSGKNAGGGVAWLGVLCSAPFNFNHGGSCPGLSPQTDNYGGAYGYSGNIGLEGLFDLSRPKTLWDIVVVSHEIGHNFNSPHTHCYNGLGGSSQPVDKCWGTEGGCYSGAASLPCATPGAGCGTLMSYCHQINPGTSNIALSFGTGHPHGVLPQRVPDRMRTHVESRAAAAPACLSRLPCTQNLALNNETVNEKRNFTVCGTIVADDDFRVGNSGEVGLIAGKRVVLGDGFSVAANGELRLNLL